MNKGEEYGAEDVEVSWEDTVDPQGCNADPETYQRYTRDPARTPFRWDSTKNAGFSSAEKTWLPVGSGYEQENVQKQLSDENSHLKIFKRLTQLRKEESAFSGRKTEPIVQGEVLIYERAPPSDDAKSDAFLVVLNIGDSDAALDLSQFSDKIGSQVEVSVSSLQSGLKSGAIAASKNFVAKAYNGYVLRLVQNA